MTEAAEGQEGEAQGSGADPVARVGGEPMLRLPDDLYIPPDALEVFLEAFEGPLDLLLYLIRRQNLDIRDIPIAEITRQYMAYVELMRELRLELAAEYLVMAAMLAEIKSRVLLPRPEAEADPEEEEGDPRAELIRRLQAYEQFKRAAERLDELPRLGRDIFPACAAAPDCQPPPAPPAVSLREMLLALSEVMRRAQLNEHHQVAREAISIRGRMSELLGRLSSERHTPLAELLAAGEGRAGVVATFFALLELVRESMVDVVQAEAFAPIYLRAR